ncbi:MAG: hypothetical protein HYS12_23540 [Planctomycetes bacterium]|nr:hypothetical protein [Planctomycetota bacterium]
MSVGRPHVVLELRPEPGSNPDLDYVRLRRVFKALLRHYGFRIVDLQFLGGNSTGPPEPPCQPLPGTPAGSEQSVCDGIPD